MTELAKLDSRTVRLLKACVRHKPPEHVRVPQITRMFWDPGGVLVGTDGTKMVAVYDKAQLLNWPTGLYWPGSCRRDSAMEEEVRKQGREDGFIDWRTQIPDGECRTLSVNQGETVLGAQAACVKAGVVINWCQHGNALKALAEIWSEETRVLCFTPARPIVIEQWRYQRQTIPDKLICTVRLVIMPCNPNLAREK